MRHLARNFGGLAAGSTIGGIVVGVAEGVYRGVPFGYAALLYGTLWALAGTALAAGWALAHRGRERAPRWLFGYGVMGSLALSTLVLGHFIVLRDVFLEAPGKGWPALGIAAAAAVAAALAVKVAGGFVERRIQWESLGGPWLWGIAALVVVVFGIRAGVGDDGLAESAPAPARELHGRGVVLVVVDALRADALGIYGAGPHRGAPASPSIDAFARSGRTFTRASAQASWTRPAVASILTSRHASGHGTMAKNAVLPATLPTVASVLSDAGVETAAVVTNYNLEPAYGFARGFADYRYLAPARYLGAPPEANRLAAYNVYRLLRERLFTAAREPRFFYRSGAAVNAQALGILDKIGDESFFLYVHYMEPHDPYFATTGESYARVSTPRPPAAWAEAMHTAYRDEVQRFDAVFAELEAGLEARGLAERTTVILVADHGEEFADHGGFYHGLTLYEEQLHIPLVLAGREVSAGSDRRLARQIDLAPTIVARFGVQPPASWEGLDLLRDDAGPEVTLAEEDHEGNILRAIRAGDDKLILANPDNPRGLRPAELYDLANDPREQYAVPASESVARLTRGLEAALEQARRGGAKAGARPDDAATEAELRALGYVQ